MPSGRVIASALCAVFVSVGGAAAAPLTLTDDQMDRVTAGDVGMAIQAIGTASGDTALAKSTTSTKAISTPGGTEVAVGHGHATATGDGSYGVSVGAVPQGSGTVLAEQTHVHIVDNPARAVGNVTSVIVVKN